MDERRLHWVLGRLSNVLREDLRAAATTRGLALAQLEALHVLAEVNRFSDTASSVGAFLGATKGTVSQTLGALVRKGLVVRERDADDGRVHHLRLTPEGRRIADATSPAAVLRGVEPEAAVALEGLLRQVLAVRGGAAFGVCATCVHHEVRAEGRWCRLVQVALREEEARLRCREHASG